MHTEPIIRNFVLRFPMDTDTELMRAMVEAWNLRFADHFGGVGYFPNEAEVESFPGAGIRGAALGCHAFYLRADSRLWAQITGSRTLTADEPALACRVAY